MTEFRELDMRANDDLKKEIPELYSNGYSAGWQKIRSSEAAEVFFNKDRRLYFKVFLPRNAAEFVKAFLRGGRAKRAVTASELLRAYGFNAPRCLAYGGSIKKQWLLMEEVEGTGYGKIINSPPEHRSEMYFKCGWLIDSSTPHM
ncbi:MAG: hypothetical protein K9N48_06300 [Verrucomicrobia bacterium]|nr:hypothetical protein [Verrucomicrobiota bacterium]